jgi:hypothetical protein
LLRSAVVPLSNLNNFTRTVRRSFCFLGGPNAESPFYEKVVFNLREIKEAYFLVNNQKYMMDLKGFNKKNNIPIDVIIELKKEEANA